MSAGRGLVVGTAGHIDHGKTSMVRSLTGVNLDQLPEEQARGITIALGFTALDLPTGRRTAFVDCPGHERLVRTMVAGATGIDAVLLCVSATDGMMPQTREHLAILQLLGLRTGAVVLTMADLVDEEMLELCLEDVAEGVAGTFLEGAPVVAFSAVTDVGKQALIDVIDAFPDTDRGEDGPFRLPVDRTFVRDGFGTVVTGTTWSGTLKDGATVRLLPGDQTARVRGIQSHGLASGVATSGARTALNLAGVDRDQVPRGTVISDAELPCPHMIDVMYRHLSSAPPLEDGSPVRVLLGTSECMGRIHAAADLDVFAPGVAKPAQIRLEAPLPCLPGDRFILRRTSPMETLGGGEILDPWTVKMRRKNRIAWGGQLKRLAAGDPLVWLERAGEEGLDPKDWKRRSGDTEKALMLGGRSFAPRIVGRLEGVLLESLGAFHLAQPMALGAQRRELRRARLGDLDERVFDALVERLSSANTVLVDGPMVRVRGFELALTPAQARLKKTIQETIHAAGLDGLKPKDLHEVHKDDEVAALLRLIEAEDFAQQTAGLGWISRDARNELRTKLQGWFQDHDTLKPGDFKALTGLTRRAAIPLMEYSDGLKWTVRAADGRVPGPALV